MDLPSRVWQPLRPFENATRPFLVATAGIPVHFTGVVLLVVACLAFPNSLPALVLASVALIALVVLCTPALTAVQRARFRVVLSLGIRIIRTPVRAPRANAIMERWWAACVERFSTGRSSGTSHICAGCSPTPSSPCVA